MDVSRFREKSPGKPVQIEGFGGWSFVPERLPPRWQFPGQLWPILAEVKQRIGELEGVGKALRNPSILIKPLLDREAIDSSTIEGTYASARELLLFQMREEEQEDGSFAEVREVSNYVRAMEGVITRSMPLNVATLREMHRILLTETRGEDKTPGVIRDRQVAVGKGYRFVPPPASEVPALMADLDEDLARSLSVDPLVDAFLVHYQFEAIHPFLDGNGRVGRALLALMICRNCGFSKPWMYLSGYFEQHRKGYTERLFRVSTHGDWDSWIEFCLKATHAQAVTTIRKCEQLIKLHQEFESRVSNVRGSFRLQRILSRLFERQFLRITDLKEILEVSYPTASADVQKLVERGILAPLEGITPKTFYSPELFGVVYEPTR